VGYCWRGCRCEDVWWERNMQEPASEDAWRRTLEQVRSATDRMMGGDSGSWKALLSPRDDVVLLGAFGGYVQERAEVDARFDRTDLACTVDLEQHHETRLAGREPTTITYRVTHLFRREPDGWKVVLRHADPLAEPWLVR